MYFLRNLPAVLEAWFARRTAVLAHPRAPRFAALLVPVLFGLLSVCLGQDDNWDMKNYHWYNPYALLNGRLALDMAPGQWQSYFNPLIDVPYYLLTQALPAPAVGFLMGLLHGLNFVLLLAIARQLLGRQRQRLTLLLAAAGTCGAGFLSELGNTMGDNMTSLLVLSSIYLVLLSWKHLEARSGRGVALVLLSGLAMGLGTGLKLTNATYALALGLALLVLPLAFGRRLGVAALYGIGAVPGLLASAGYWWLTMWNRFGNPLFPQFNNIFHSPLAQELGVIDQEHLPHGVLETLFWPFVFTVHFRRVSEIVLKAAILPALYLVAIVFVYSMLAERLASRPAPGRLSPQARFLLVFGLAAYLTWLKLFSIYRYLVPLELLAPLMLWLLLERIAARPRAARIGGWTLAIITLVVFPFRTWGHVGWASASFSAEFPPFAQPASTIIFTAHGDPPMGWLATLAPREVRVISLGSGFPESPAYVARIHAAIAARPGPHYVMLTAARNQKDNGLRRTPEQTGAPVLAADSGYWARFVRMVHRVRLRVQARFAASTERQRMLELQTRYAVGMEAKDLAIIRAAQDNLAHYGLKIDAAACKRYPATIGAELYPFQLCPVVSQG